MAISYAITACSEHVELKNLIEQIRKNTNVNDEILLQLDCNHTSEVYEVAQHYNVNCEIEYHRIIFALNGDFAAFKNNLKDHCSREYIYFLDADEMISQYTIRILPDILKMNANIDMISVPRINIVEGITPEDIKKYGWVITKPLNLNQGHIEEKELDLTNLKDLEFYNMLNKHNLIISEDKIS